MNIKEQVQKMDAMVSQGDIVNAVKQFFSANANTSDYGGVKTASRDQMVEKMEGFTGAIAQVNGITHHRTLVDGNASASEFTFDFDMKDNSRILWHEIIRRVWNDSGEVVEETYFDAKIA
ncbi:MULTISPECIES: hypothetical protein [Roseivirga]|jgi:hypothetical protein|uniref:Nuclear transport factor 2 family protein n=1 Tax=Roseivirga thermotolerans TaxID=1758176 RepID=A0ABQ3IAS6_9BACT|nr:MULTISPECIES: hypothetical protein [Roseivirga]MEC7752667.1 hypothetical protein [Bacteroidota bacterium]GHE66472.1 hypothetical protein GCM10011340_22240 [Roseivirga thermotolerans]|tara:strand:- start:16720 stop:17079 length:360 start_codon:yes stop_codon:yes gene_type:complete